MEQNLRQRTKSFALRVVRLTDALPNRRSANVIGSQLVRAGTSVGSNYRAAQRARTKKDFLYKLGLVEEEADECCYWLELLVDSGHIKPARIADLQREANELTAIIVACILSGRRTATR